MSRRLRDHELRSHWFRQQGLGEQGWFAAADCLRGSGWLRSIGGIDVYLALWARIDGWSRTATDEDVHAGRVRIVPAVRGCMYLVPEDEVPLALRCAELQSQARMAREIVQAGADEAEAETLRRATLEALKAGPATTQGLRKQIPAGILRSLGEAGKKVGMSSLLPTVLRRLEFAGLVERRCQNDRLDHEDYIWACTDENPHDLYPTSNDPVDLAEQLALRFFSWAGPASLDEFTRWSGLSKSQARRGMDRLTLTALTDELGRELWLQGEFDPEPPQNPERAHLTSFADNFVALHQHPGQLAAPDLTDIQVASWGRSTLQPLGASEYLHLRCLLDGPELVGAWSYSPRGGAIELHQLGAARPHQLARVAELQRLVDDAFGNARANTLDSDRRLQDRNDRLRAAFAAVD